MSDLFYAALGGAILILIYGCIQMRRWYPFTRAELKSIKARLDDVEAGRAKPIEQVRAELRNEAGARERERIQKQEVCSDKSHWRSE